MLYGVTAADPVTYVVCGLVLAVGGVRGGDRPGGAGDAGAPDGGAAVGVVARVEPRESFASVAPCPHCGSRRLNSKATQNTQNGALRRRRWTQKPRRRIPSSLAPGSF